MSTTHGSKNKKQKNGKLLQKDSRQSDSEFLAVEPAKPSGGAGNGGLNLLEVGDWAGYLDSSGKMVSKFILSLFQEVFEERVIEVHDRN